VSRSAREQPLYGADQSRFARYVERREARSPDPGFRELRRRLVACLAGAVVEVGAGGGPTFEHYQPEVERLLAVEPDPVARAQAAERAASVPIQIEIVEGFADSLPAADASYDAAVVSGLLCSVPDPQAALEELRRVLRPGGELRFLEHVRSGNPAFRGLQRAVDRLFWTRALGGCETTRDTLGAIRAAGFEVESLERGFHSASVLTITAAPYVLGVARR
jgi:ubiquinone/menaquinone biosynthesis C-methylase UbiE